jgi:hypothetical protein
MSAAFSPVSYAASKPSAKPTRHRALRREAKQFCRSHWGAVTVLDQPHGNFSTLYIQNRRKIRSEVEELSMDCAPVACKMFGNALDRATPARKRREYKLANFVGPLMRSCVDCF